MKKAYFVLFALIVVVGIYFITDMRNTLIGDGELTKADTIMVEDTKKAVETVAANPITKHLENDADAIEALKRCEDAHTGLEGCIKILQRQYNVVVTGLKPEQVAEDGFGGFMIFPLEDGDTVILDYNADSEAQQFIYFGDFEALKKDANAGKFDETFARRVNAVEKVVSHDNE